MDLLVNYGINASQVQASQNIGFEAAFTSTLPTPNLIDNRLSSYGINNNRLELLTTNTASYDAGYPYPSLGWDVQWSGDFEASVDHTITTYSTSNVLYLQYMILLLEDGGRILIGAGDGWGQANQVSFNARTPDNEDGLGTGFSGPPIDANDTYKYKITRINGTLRFYENNVLWYTSTGTYNQNVVQVQLTTARYLSTTSPSANYNNLYLGNIK